MNSQLERQPPQLSFGGLWILNERCVLPTVFWKRVELGKKMVGVPNFRKTSPKQKQEQPTIMILQPILVPCKGTAVDLVLSVDPANDDHLHLFWGTSLLQVIPRDHDSLLFRVVGGMLTGLGFKMSAIEEAFRTTAKTLRKWADALRKGNWEALAAVFHGPGAATKLRPDIEQYVRARYREACASGTSNRVPYRFREDLLLELMRYWKLGISGEVLRRVFRDEDENMAPGSAKEAHTQAATTRELALRENGEQAELENAVVSCVEGRERECEGAVTDTAAKPNREEGCASGPDSSTKDEQTRNLPPCFVTTHFTPGYNTTPLFADSSSGEMMSQHAGLFLLYPWFDKVFGSAPGIVRQTASQILLGQVNQEQSKNIDYCGLGLLVSDPVCDIGYQHRCLEGHLNNSVLMDLYARNADFLNLKGQRIFYVDTHHKEYAGMLKILFAWSGKHHKALKGILMDVIHTEFGAPCFIGHSDNYYDARERFFLLVECFRKLFPEEAEGFVWINDRGYWADYFLRQVAENRNYFIQWEKGYVEGSWDLAFQQKGTFAIRRKRNNRNDIRKVKVRWREQVWEKFSGARRFIVRISRSGAEAIEVAIVTNHPNMKPERVIRLMLGRWLQENDFCYLTRHFGIDELGGRKAEPYANIIDDLEDRNVKSRQFKRAEAKRARMRAKLGRELVNLQSMPALSLEQLAKEREKIRDQADKLSDKLARIKAGKMPEEAMQDIRTLTNELTEKSRLNKKDKKSVEKRVEQENEAAQIRQELMQLEANIAQMNRKESRLLALVEEKYVRHDMRKKALLDAIRIVCRNIFRAALDIFRPLYNNYRDDHAVLRQLSRSSGVIIRYPERIDLFLTPALHRQPAQWAIIKKFFDICAHRIKQRFDKPIRIFADKTSQEIFAAVERSMRSHASQEICQ